MMGEKALSFTTPAMSSGKKKSQAQWIGQTLTSEDIMNSRGKNSEDKDKKREN